MLYYGSITRKNGGYGLLPREQRPVKNWTVQCWVAKVCVRLDVPLHSNGLPLGGDPESGAIREMAELLGGLATKKIHQENGFETGNYLWLGGVSVRDTGTCTYVGDAEVKRDLTVPVAFEEGWYRCLGDGDPTSTHGSDWKPERVREWLLAPSFPLLPVPANG